MSQNSNIKKCLSEFKWATKEVMVQSYINLICKKKKKIQTRIATLPARKKKKKKKKQKIQCPVNT